MEAKKRRKLFVTLNRSRSNFYQLFVKCIQSAINQLTLLLISIFRLVHSHIYFGGKHLAFTTLLAMQKHNKWSIIWWRRRKKSAETTVGKMWFDVNYSPDMNSTAFFMYRKGLLNIKPLKTYLSCGQGVCFYITLWRTNS